ncbi:MAG: hypothetical protein EXS47_00920 [Candidatus Zambryskibacteria bacterium]|nr:hypothetical protein [Candidatus Zambryskibacteria bacterium]
MSESFKNKDRIKFRKDGIQRRFILKTKEILGITESELAKKLKISRRTIQEWTKERITISKIAIEKMSKWTKLPIPKNHKIISWKLYLQIAGKIGSRAKIKMYGNVGGDEKYRKEKWRVWWDITGQHRKTAPGFQSIIKIKIPRKSILLAEFVGIMLGDGGINKYHTSITLSSEEKQYISFVSKKIKELFGVTPKIYKLSYAKAVKIVVNRKQLIDFCQTIGLARGNKIKQQVDIPRWVKENRKFSISCIRGLIDTDGCFYTNSYYVNGKKYSYFKIAFISASKLLAHSVLETLINLGINARIDKNHRDVRIVDSEHVAKYIREIGSHNQKHIDKIEKWKVALNGKAAVC